MKRRLVLRSEAHQELEDAVAWYEAQLPALGREFRIEVYRYFDLIADNPLLYSPARGDSRRAVMRRFPYLIYYLVEEKRVVIIAVFHAKRNPDELEGRG